MLKVFVTSVLRVAERDIGYWVKEVDERVGTGAVRYRKISAVDEGAEFEIRVARSLQKLGWTVQLCGKAGDQGGDLLAQKAGKTAVIQCKRYQSRVGNAAVQEVIAARHFYHVDLAVVVASSGFTRQAHALAEKARVLLLSSDQLDAIG